MASLMLSTILSQTFVVTKDICHRLCLISVCNVYCFSCLQSTALIGTEIPKHRTDIHALPALALMGRISCVVPLTHRGRQNRDSTPMSLALFVAIYIPRPIQRLHIVLCVPEELLLHDDETPMTGDSSSSMSLLCHCHLFAILTSYISFLFLVYMVY